MKKPARKYPPWRDRSGRLAPLKLAVFAALFVPGLWLAFAYADGLLGARPVMEMIHQAGLWTIRLLFISLAITPLRESLAWPQLVIVRRMIGVAAFAYGASHLTLYATDEAFDLAKVASEIVLRFYLAIGFVALLGLSALAATSTDAMVRRLGGKRWKNLHRIVYAIALLATVHYFIQVKADVSEPLMMAGFYAWLMGYRTVAALRREKGASGLPTLVALGLGAAAATALGEAVYFWIKLGVDPLRVLAADFSLVTGARPGLLVLLAGLAVVIACALRRFWPRARSARTRTGFAEQHAAGAE